MNKYLCKLCIIWTFLFIINKRKENIPSYCMINTMKTRIIRVILHVIAKNQAINIKCNISDIWCICLYQFKHVELSYCFKGFPSFFFSLQRKRRPQGSESEVMRRHQNRTWYPPGDTALWKIRKWDGWLGAAKASWNTHTPTQARICTHLRTSTIPQGGQYVLLETLCPSLI